MDEEINNYVNTLLYPNAIISTDYKRWRILVHDEMDSLENNDM